MSVKTGRSHSRPAAESGINGDEWIKVIYGLLLSVLVGNRMKREGKELHGASVKRIHEERQDPVEVINYTRLFDRLEKCTYNCKEVPILWKEWRSVIPDKGRFTQPLHALPGLGGKGPTRLI